MNASPKSGVHPKEKRPKGCVRHLLADDPNEKLSSTSAKRLRGRPGGAEEMKRMSS